MKKKLTLIFLLRIFPKSVAYKNRFQTAIIIFTWSVITMITWYISLLTHCMNPVCCVYMMLPENSDPVYSLLKGAFMLRKGGEGDSSGVSSMRSLPRQSTASSGRSVSSRSSSPGNVYTILYIL